MCGGKKQRRLAAPVESLMTPPCAVCHDNPGISAPSHANSQPHHINPAAPLALVPQLHPAPSTRQPQKHGSLRPPPRTRAPARPRFRAATCGPEISSHTFTHRVKPGPGACRGEGQGPSVRGDLSGLWLIGGRHGCVFGARLRSSCSCFWVVRDASDASATAWQYRRRASGEAGLAGSGSAWCCV